MKKYTITKKEYRELQAIFCGIWCLKYDSNLNNNDKELIRECIKMNFYILDNEYKTPFYIQNKIISYADKKNNIDFYLDTLLQRDNIEVL